MRNSNTDARDNSNPCSARLWAWCETAVYRADVRTYIQVGCCESGEEGVKSRDGLGEERIEGAHACSGQTGI
jgi:hypothetical protein